MAAIGYIAEHRSANPPGNDAEANVATTNTISDVSWQFAVAGDSEGGADVFAKIVERINQSDARLFVHLGDLTDAGTTEQMATAKAQLAQLHMPFYATLGSHEIRNDPERTEFTTTFNAPRLSFVERNAHFILLDNADRKVGFADDELDWLETELKNFQCPTTFARCFTFLFFHRPVPAELFALFPDDETAASRASNQRFLKILQRHPVDRIFSGHIHAYFNYDLSSTPVTISGGAGSPPQEFLANLFGSDALFHYLVVTVNPDSYDISIQRIK